MIIKSQKNMLMENKDSWIEQWFKIYPSKDESKAKPSVSKAGNGGHILSEHPIGQVQLSFSL